MKKFFIYKCMNYIKKNTEYDEVKLKEIEYGIVSLYLTIYKFIIISLLSLLLNIFKEMIIFTLIFNIIRAPAFGLHATKNWICLLSSTLFFIGIPIICTQLNIDIFLKIIIGLINIILIYKNAPADTKKRPIINKKRRRKYKLISTLIAVIFSFLSFKTNNNFLSNCFIFAIILENVLISPMIYKLFKLPYNNYITYLKEHPNFINH